MPAPIINDLPDAPSRLDEPLTFIAKADAFVEALQPFVDEANALGDYLEALESGTLSAKLAAIDALTWAANKLIYLTGTNTVASSDLTADGRGLIGAANYAAMRALLDLEIGTDIPARTPQIQSVTSSATVTPTFADDQVNITAQAAGLTLANPTGTAVDGWGIAIRIKDNGTARAISYGSQYRALGVTLPATTVISKTLYLGLIFNNADTKWDVVAVAQEV